MKVGVLKEIKNHEYRVGLIPSSVRELTNRGHAVFIQTMAGTAAGFTDEMYQSVGAMIVPTAADIFTSAEMIVKVKEPQPSEWIQLTGNHTLFTYLHLAPDVEQARGLQASGCTAISYETVTDAQGGLPLLCPMSEIAGRLSIQAGAHCLEKAQGGRGILLGGVAGVAPAQVVVIGGGVVGIQAIRMAIGLGARVTVLERSLPRLKELHGIFGNKLTTLYSNEGNLEAAVETADLVVGAVLVPGASAPRLITRKLLARMKPGSVFVDVAIDQGGCSETSRATTYADPTYVEEGIIHYCVANMPGGVPYTSTIALSNATLPFVIELAEKGAARACKENMHLRNGLNVCKGSITHPTVAQALGQPFVDPITLL